MVEAAKNQSGSSHWWWLVRDPYSMKQNRSPWLQSKIAELNEKTKAMLELIEADADSFGQRAELYFQKRPELIKMVEDFYGIHCSLAVRWDHLKSHSLSSTEASEESDAEYSQVQPVEESNSDKDMQSWDSKNIESDKATNPCREGEGEGEEEEEEKDELVKLMEEMKRVREENKSQKEQLEHKDEEKREVIRQLSLAMDLLREENLNLRQLVAAIRGGPRTQNPLSRLFIASAKSSSSCPQPPQDACQLW